MVSRAYHSLGHIESVTTLEHIPGSVRSTDRNRFQTFILEFDPNRPFTGTVNLEGSVDDPNVTDSQFRSWVPLMEMTFIGHQENLFIEFEIEITNVRFNATAYDPNVSISSDPSPMYNGIGDGIFTLDNTAITIRPGSDILSIKQSIDNIMGDLYLTSITDNNNLIITKSDGSSFTASDTSTTTSMSTPLADMGFPTGTFHPNGRIINIKGMR